MKEIIKTVTPVPLKVGYPETKEELDAMFRLRAEVYRREGYITDQQNGKDGYDLDNKCVYFIAKIDEKLVGTGRLVIDDPLPTEVYFDFEEPEEMSHIPRNKRGEIGRMIGVVREMNHLVLLSLVKAMMEFGKENDILGGYAFMQRYVVQFLDSMRFPIHLVEPYALKNGEGPFYDYLEKSGGSEVLPIYYLRDEGIQFMEKMKL